MKGELKYISTLSSFSGNIIKYQIEQNLPTEDLVDIPNATFGGNAVGRVVNMLGYSFILQKELCVTAYLQKGCEP